VCVKEMVRVCKGDGSCLCKGDGSWPKSHAPRVPLYRGSPLSPNPG